MEVELGLEGVRQSFDVSTTHDLGRSGGGGGGVRCLHT